MRTQASQGTGTIEGKVVTEQQHRDAALSVLIISGTRFVQAVDIESCEEATENVNMLGILKQVKKIEKRLQIKH